jgi:hypothetical protein
VYNAYIKSNEGIIMKYNKFTNDVRVKIETMFPTLEEKKEYLIEWMDETSDPQYSRLRNQIKKARTIVELQKIMFNMQLMSEGLGVL